MKDQVSEEGEDGGKGVDKGDRGTPARIRKEVKGCGEYKGEPYIKLDIGLSLTPC